MSKAPLFLLALAISGLAQSIQIPVDIELHRETGLRLKGLFTILSTGTLVNAKLDWTLTLKNKSGLWFKTIEFCIVLIGEDGAMLKNEKGNVCLLRVSRGGWDKDESITARGNQQRSIQPLISPLKILGARIFILDFHPTAQELLTGIEQPPDRRDLADRLLTFSSPSGPAAPDTHGEVLVQIDSSQLDSEIEIDGKFIGSNPSSVRISAGIHDISIIKRGFLTWQRSLSIKDGEVRRVTATLEKSPN